MQQKVQFIVTVLHEPELLIFDEPFSGFDPINANLLKKEILELRDKGATIIFSTHNMSSVEEVCDQIALINKSRKILEGEVNEVRRRYSTNTYELHFQGGFNKIKAGLTADYAIESLTQQNDLTKLVLSLKTDMTTNQLLERMVQYGQLVYFTEQVPDMNSIFIQAVNEYNQQAKNA